MFMSLAAALAELSVFIQTEKEKRWNGERTRAQGGKEGLLRFLIFILNLNRKLFQLIVSAPWRIEFLNSLIC